MEKHKKIRFQLSKYRYEFLLSALILLIFDKIFFPGDDLYLPLIWPLNMLIIALACYGIFNEKKGLTILLRNIMCSISILMPFLFILFSTYSWFLYFLTFFYIVFYLFIFYEVLRQITMTREVRLNVVIGSFCGYLLLSMVAVFSFILVELLLPNAFHGLGETIPVKYTQLSYFSFVTLTSIGFGDIYPIHDSSRLTVVFFGMLGQFYMVAVVGIIISKFTSNSH